MSAAERFDAIVIGSGMGALTCASLLAQLRDMRVLVLERHWRLGGFTHVFSRPGGGPWPVGVHYVGQMSDGDPVRVLMDIVTGYGVQWNAMPDRFERFHFPSFVMDQSSHWETYLEELASLWPIERQAIIRYAAAVDEGYEYFAKRLLPRRAAHSDFADTGRRSPKVPEIASLTTAQVLDGCGVRDGNLRAVLTAQWGNYGLPPRCSSFIAHAVIARHFRDGGWFPANGAEAIATSTRSLIEGAGGECRTSHSVEQLLIQRGRVVGVRAHGTGKDREPRDFLAPLVISGVGAYNTFNVLLPRSDVAGDAFRTLPALRDATSAVQLFIRLNRSPSDLGVCGENHWLFSCADHDVMYDNRNRLLDGEAATAYLSFPSSKVAAPEYHTAEIIAPLDFSAFAAWKDRPWRRRGNEYEALKEAISETLLDFAERHVTGLRGLSISSELATPITVQRFTSHPRGAIYGLPPTVDRFSVATCNVATHLPGLLLTGSDVGAAGVVGAMMGGVATVAHVLGPGGMHRVLAAAQGRAARTALQLTMTQ